MLHHPNSVLDLKLATELIQPNAIDVPITTLSIVSRRSGVADFRKGNKPKTSVVIEPFDNHWFLDAGSCYQFESSIHLKIPAGYAGWLITRSTLNRNGLFVVSGLYDSGFEGFIGGTIYCFNDALIDVGMRIAQFVMVDSDSVGQYEGYYNQPKGDE